MFNRCQRCFLFQTISKWFHMSSLTCCAWCVCVLLVLRQVSGGWWCEVKSVTCLFHFVPSHIQIIAAHTHTCTQTLPAFLQHESVCGAWLLLRQPLLHSVTLKKCIPASKIKAEFILSCNTKSSKCCPRKMQWLVFLVSSTFPHAEDKKEFSCDWLSGEQSGAAVPLLHDTTHAITHHPRPRSWGWAEDQVD